MRSTALCLSSALFLVTAGCEGGSNSSNPGPAGDASGASDASAGGAASGGACGRGKYPTKGLVSFCPQQEAECKPVEEARGYTFFYGDVQVRKVAGLEALSCMMTVGQLSIHNGAGLRALTGLSGLSQIGTMHVINNLALESLAGMDSLKALEDLNLRGNGLKSVGGLPKGLVIQNLYIEDHDDLTSLAGLEDITVTKNIGIVNNPKLPTCAAEAFAQRFPGVKATIERNSTTPCN